MPELSPKEIIGDRPLLTDPLCPKQLLPLSYLRLFWSLRSRMERSLRHQPRQGVARILIQRIDDQLYPLGVGFGGGLHKGVRLALMPEHGANAVFSKRLCAGGEVLVQGRIRRKPRRHFRPVQGSRSEAHRNLLRRHNAVAKQRPGTATTATPPGNWILGGDKILAVKIDHPIVFGLLFGITEIRRVGLASGDQHLADADFIHRLFCQNGAA